MTGVQTCALPISAADAQQPTETLTRADVEKMAREIAANVTAEQQTKIDAQQRVTSELKTLGYAFESAPGRTILQYAIDNSLSLTDAADWYEKDTATSMAAKQQAAAAAAGQIPGVAPNGSPVGQFSPPERKAGESDADYRRSMIRARLENNTSAR